jgi:5-formyltetrahydrofolate cyclo-ligase
VNESKHILRRQFLQQRQALSIVTWQTQSDRLCHHLVNCAEFTTARTVLVYQSFRQEPNLEYLFQHTDKQWGLPRCVDRDLQWHSWQPADPLVVGNYGILEPSVNLPLLELSNIDLILVPAVAIDHQGYRLGYGGGYYDRLFTNPLWAKVPTIGIVFDFSYLARLPIDPWDRSIDAVCTELGLNYINSTNQHPQESS